MSMDRTEQWLYSHRSDLPVKKIIAETIAITGGKGGVGKTSTALKMAKVLSENKKVLLIDCDHNLSNTAIKLGVSLNNDFLSLVKLKKSFDQCIVKNGNFHLLAGCSGDLELLDSTVDLAKLIVSIIAQKENNYDYILLDCPAGLATSSLLVSAYCKHRIIVLTPDKSSITDSYSLVKILNSKYGVTENHLLVNKTESFSQYRRVIKTFSETVENFLGCRTNILGGVQKSLCNTERFDQELLMNKNSTLHKNFVKIVDNFSEKILVGVDDTLIDVSRLHRMPKIEHEVQTI